MLHLRPLPYEKVAPEVQQVYQQTMTYFGAPATPLVFQYIANFPRYCLHLWQKLVPNVSSPVFAELVAQAQKITSEGAKSLYIPSQGIASVVVHMHQSERDELSRSAQMLTHVNAALLILMVGIRESLKGVYVTERFELQAAHVEQEQMEVESVFALRIRSEQAQELSPSGKMLAPLFGQKDIFSSSYSAYFTQLSQAMDTLVMDTQFLQWRVMLEQAVMQMTHHLPNDIGITYAQLMELAGDRPYFTELLYLLSDAFPSQFPRLLFTSYAMLISIQGEKGTAIVT